MRDCVICFLCPQLYTKKNLENDIEDEYEQEMDEDTESDAEMEIDAPLNEDTNTDARALNAWRDGIAQQMWTSYLQHTGDE